MQIGKDVLKKLAALVVLGVALNWLLHNLELVGGILATVWGLIYPFVLGFILAFILNIPMRALERLLFRGRGGRLRRPVSFVLTLVLLLGVIALVVFLVAPQLAETLTVLWKSMPEYVARMQKTLEPYEAYVPQLQELIDSMNINWQKLTEQAIDLLQSGAGSFLSSAYGVATSIIGGVVSFAIGIIFAGYLLLDKEHLTAQLQGLLKAYLPKKRYEKLKEVASLCSHTFSKFVSGQCTEALAVSLMFLVVLSVGGFDYSLLISVLIGFTSFIPMFGAYIGCIIGALLILISMGFWRALAFVIVFIVVQQLDGTFVYPRIVGSSVGLPALWVLVAVTVGGGLMGVFGMLFFIPLASVAYTLLHRDARRRLQDKGILSPVVEMQQNNPSVRRKGRGWGRGRPKAEAPKSDEETAQNEKNNN